MHVEKNPEIFSSARSIVVGDPDPSFPLEAGFITMDGPMHDAHRKVVQPVASPRNLTFPEPLIRERVAEILDGEISLRTGLASLTRQGGGSRWSLRRSREGHVLAGRDRAALTADASRRGVNVREK